MCHVKEKNIVVCQDVEAVSLPNCPLLGNKPHSLISVSEEALKRQNSTGMAALKEQKPFVVIERKYAESLGLSRSFLVCACVRSHLHPHVSCMCARQSVYLCGAA